MPHEDSWQDMLRMLSQRRGSSGKCPGAALGRNTAGVGQGKGTLGALLSEGHFYSRAEETDNCLDMG
jgi:hypothetical protein